MNKQPNEALLSQALETDCLGLYHRFTSRIMILYLSFLTCKMNDSLSLENIITLSGKKPRYQYYMTPLI